MRTSPNDAIAGIRALLREGIGPELGSKQAIFLLRRAMAVLRETDWNEAAFELLAENEVFCALAGEVRMAIGDAPVPAALDAWQALASQDRAPTSYAEAADANAALRAAIAKTIAALDGSPSAPAVRRTMLSSLLSLHRNG